MLKIIADSIEYPVLFHWNGAVDCKILKNWVRENRLNPPQDVFEMWCTTGGGDFFESETILGPFADAAMADDVLSVNQFHWSKGMSRDILLFHRGLGGLSGVIAKSGEVVVLNIENYQAYARYSSLEDWYSQLVRPEYAERYGLSPSRAPLE